MRFSNTVVVKSGKSQCWGGVFFRLCYIGKVAYVNWVFYASAVYVLVLVSLLS